MENNTAAVAKRARVGPRTQIVLTMEKLFSNMLSSKKCLLITIIVFDNVLKLWLELIKERNDNVTEQFYRVQCFLKVPFLVEISKILKISTISKIARKALLLYELSEREPG